jgi:uncharacterized membrane protein
MSEAGITNHEVNFTAGDITGGSSLSLATGTVFVGLAVVLHLLITIPLAYKLNIWTDEAFTLNTTAKTLGYAINQANHFEQQPPLYFMLLNLWRGMCDTIFFARLFSVGCAALAIVVAALISIRLYPRANPGWIALLLAVHPFTIWSATEIRLYSFALLLSSLLILLLLRGFLDDNSHIGYKLGYALIAIAALYTQYYLGFILVANACALIVNRRWRALASYLACMAVVAICFLPMLSLVVAQVHSSTAGPPMSFRDAVTSTVFQVKEFALPLDATKGLLLIRTWLIRAFYVGALVLLVRRRQRLLTASNLVVWTILSVVAAFFVLAHMLVPEGMLLERHMVGMFLLVILACFSFLMSLEPRFLRVVVFATLMVFAVWASFTTFRTLSKAGSWDRVALYLHEHEKADQPIAVFHAGAALPLSYYYHGMNRLVALPRENRFDRYDLHDYVATDGSALRNALTVQGGAPKEAWLVTDGECGFAGIDFRCEVLEDWVNADFEVEGTVKIGSTSIRLLRKK